MRIMQSGTKYCDYPESWTVLRFLWEKISGFWNNEKVPPLVKETMLNHFLEEANKDLTD